MKYVYSTLTLCACMALFVAACDTTGVSQESADPDIANAKADKVAICHVGNETGPEGQTWPYTWVVDDVTYQADAGKIDLIEVAQPANHLENESHSFAGWSDYLPFGDGKEDSDGDGVDDGCEPPVLAIAYTDVDPNDGDDFNPGVDALIAKLSDGPDLDHVPGPGDLVRIGTFPGSFAGSPRVAVGKNLHVVSEAELAKCSGYNVPYIIVRTAGAPDYDDFRFYIDTLPATGQEAYLEYAYRGGVAKRTYLRDGIGVTSGPSDQMEIRAESASAPIINPNVVTTRGGGSDDSFIDAHCYF